jgi:hypothetical protein
MMGTRLRMMAQQDPSCGEPGILFRFLSEKASLRSRPRRALLLTC